MKLLTPQDPQWFGLFRSTSDVTDIDEQVRPHLNQMKRIIFRYRAHGLAASQVGVFFKFFLTSLDGERKLYINPRITLDSSDTMFRDRTAEEGCLSFPNRFRRVVRTERILIEYSDGSFPARKRKVVEGFEARVLQHETDHLNGICIFPEKEGEQTAEPVITSEVSK